MRHVIEINAIEPADSGIPRYEMINRRDSIVNQRFIAEAHYFNEDCGWALVGERAIGLKSWSYAFGAPREGILAEELEKNLYAECKRIGEQEKKNLSYYNLSVSMIDNTKFASEKLLVGGK